MSTAPSTIHVSTVVPILMLGIQHLSMYFLVASSAYDLTRHVLLACAAYQLTTSLCRKYACARARVTATLAAFVLVGYPVMLAGLPTERENFLDTLFFTAALLGVCAGLAITPEVVRTTDAIPPASQRPDRGGSKQTPSDGHTAAAAKANILLQRVESLYAGIDAPYEQLLTRSPDELNAASIEIAAACVKVTAAVNEIPLVIRQLAAPLQDSPLKLAVHHSIPVVSCYLLRRLYKPEVLAVLFVRALFDAAMLVWLCTCRISGAYDESDHKHQMVHIVELLCGSVGAGVFALAYPLYGVAAATALGGLAIGLVCLAITCIIRHFLPHTAHRYLRTALRKHAADAGAQQLLPGPHPSPAAMHESFRAISTSAIAQTRRAVDRTLAPRRMALDACARSLELAVYLNAPVAVCFLGLFWPARGLPVVSALSALVVSEALAALGRRIAGPLMHELAAIGLILGSMGHALSSGCTRPLSAIADDGPRVG